jgi:ABC-type lipoprotein release transport system permease subunit
MAYVKTIQMVAGRFLTSEDGDNIFIGQILADHFNVNIEDRISLIVQVA